MACANIGLASRLVHCWPRRYLSIVGCVVLLDQKCSLDQKISFPKLILGFSNLENSRTSYPGKLSVGLAYPPIKPVYHLHLASRRNFFFTTLALDIK